MKKIFISIVALTITAALAGCGKVEVNVDELASELAAKAVYAETLNEVSSDVTLKRYGIDETLVDNCAAYTGTKAVADEIAVFKTDDTKAIEEKVTEHWNTQIESYKSYRPEEVPKLENAVLYTYNDTVIFCVSEDSDASRQIIIDYTSN